MPDQNERPAASGIAVGAETIGTLKHRKTYRTFKRRNQQQFADVSAACVANIEVLAIELLGHPLVRTRIEWRWGSHGSLALRVAGPKRGLWFSHEENKGGGPIKLIASCRGCSVAEAWTWARHWIEGRS